MLTITDEGGGGVSQKLTIADKGGRGRKCFNKGIFDNQECVKRRNVCKLGHDLIFDHTALETNFGPRKGQLFSHFYHLNFQVYGPFLGIHGLKNKKEND